MPFADSPPPEAARTPVIVVTDIGDDTDDSWALVYALKNPELDVKLIVTTCGKQQYRAALIAKFLTIARRTDIPIGLGSGTGDSKRRMQNWLRDFSMDAYPGKIITSGVQALIDTVTTAKIPVTIIDIGPFQTLGAALQKNPAFAPRANFITMAGSISVGYGNKPGQIIEYNIWRDIPNAQRVFSAPWHHMVMAPLDIGGSVSIVGARYAALLGRGDALVQALLLNHAMANQVEDPAKINFGSSGFDNVAVFLAEADSARFANIEKLKITLTAEGKTMISPSGKEMKIATGWKNLDGFLDHLDQSLLLPVTPKP